MAAGAELLSQLQDGEFWVDEQEFLQEFDEVTIGFPVTEAGHLQSLYSGSHLRGGPRAVHCSPSACGVSRGGPRTPLQGSWYSRLARPCLRGRALPSRWREAAVPLGSRCGSPAWCVPAAHQGRCCATPRSCLGPGSRASRPEAAGTTAASPATPNSGCGSGSRARCTSLSCRGPGRAWPTGPSTPRGGGRVPWARTPRPWACTCGRWVRGAPRPGRAGATGQRALPQPRANRSCAGRRDTSPWG